MSGAPPNTTMETVRFGDRAVARITYQPSWRWTSDIEPLARDDLCQVNHFVYVLSGERHVVLADGTALGLRLSDIATIPAGYDSLVVGDEPRIFLDFGDAVHPVLRLFRFLIGKGLGRACYNSWLPRQVVQVCMR